MKMFEAWLCVIVPGGWCNLRMLIDYTYSCTFDQLATSELSLDRNYNFQRVIVLRFGSDFRARKLKCKCYLRIKICMLIVRMLIPNVRCLGLHYSNYSYTVLWCRTAHLYADSVPTWILHQYRSRKYVSALLVVICNSVPKLGHRCLHAINSCSVLNPIL